MKQVISASRRTDLVAYYPDAFVQAMEAYPPDWVHTIVIWTKHPANMFDHVALNKMLGKYDQLYVHFTITGMGGSVLEPGTPKTEESLKLLPDLIRFVGRPERVRVRFDPIVNLRMDGKRYSNIARYEEIAPTIREMGIASVSISWMQVYRKVARRLEAHGVEVASYDLEEQWAWMQEVSRRCGIALHACCVEGVPTSACIDGELLTRLHPKGERCSWARARDQRKLCGCTKSLDIGWYSQVCPGGCLYCYATPGNSPNASFST